MSAPIWLPVFELLGYSNRKIVPTEISYIWIPPWQLLTLLLPRAFGQAFEAKYLQMFVEMGVSHDRSLYLGLAALPLIGLALWRPIDRRVYFFAGLVAGAIVVVTCAPVYVHITKYIPVLKAIRAIQRISILYAFGGSVLAAYGASRLLAADRAFLINFLVRVRHITVRLLDLLVAATLSGCRGSGPTGRALAAPNGAAGRDRGGRHIAGARGRSCRRARSRAARAR